MKCCSSCLYCCYFLKRCISIWISRYSRCCFYFRYFRYYTFFWPWEFKFFFQLINGKSRALQKLLKHFNEITTFSFSILFLFGTLPITFALYSKDLLALLLLFFYLTVISIIFICIIIYVISITNPQTSWCYRIIVAIFLQIIHWHISIKILCIAYKSVIDFWYVLSPSTVILSFTAIYTSL